MSPLSPVTTTGLKSFWMAGFEAASHLNWFGERIDMIAGTRHDEYLQQDYEAVAGLGMRVIREALRWHLIDRGPGRELDFSSFVPFLKAAQKTGLQVIWTLHHYGFPDDVDPLSSKFVDRFVRYAKAAAKIIREETSEVPYYTPINEISFFSWAGSRNFMYPFAEGRDDELKRQLVRATVQCCDALREIDPRCRFMYCDPIIHVVAPVGADPDFALQARQMDESQFEAWDMIAGRRAPDLGGREELLDIIGMNFYHSNQWEFGGSRLPWEETPRDQRWLPLHRMMGRVWDRYKRPLFLAETSHVGVGRADWIIEVAQETVIARQNGVPIEGICLFPILDRYDWGNPNHWHNSGLFDLRIDDNSYRRVLNPEYAEGLRKARLILPD